MFVGFHFILTYLYRSYLSFTANDGARAFLVVFLKHINISKHPFHFRQCCCIAMKLDSQHSCGCSIPPIGSRKHNAGITNFQQSKRLPKCTRRKSNIFELVVCVRLLMKSVVPISLVNGSHTIKVNYWSRNTIRKVETHYITVFLIDTNTFKPSGQPSS
ncbi:hypothetical protein DIRU0_E28128 [Diutina rugosa]